MIMRILKKEKCLISEKECKTHGSSRIQSEEGTPKKGCTRHLRADSHILLLSAQRGDIATNDLVLDTIPGGRVYQARPKAKIAIFSQTLPRE
jgi:hypothetical protein